MQIEATAAGWEPATVVAAPSRGMDGRYTYVGTREAEMLGAPAAHHLRSFDSVTTRTAVLVTIGLLAVLLAVVALATLFAGDISERAGAIVTTVLGSFATVLAGLLLFLRVETVSMKVDEAASKAHRAAETAAVVETKVDRVHEDMLNGGLRENLKKAISEDRHAQRNRDMVTLNRAELDELKRRAAERERPDV